jgi:hypothetical protein
MRVIIQNHQQESLVVHVRLSHSGGASSKAAGDATTPGKLQQTEHSSVQSKLRPDPDWMPPARIAIPSISTMNAGKI